jgi:hypothetical protein
MLRRLIKEEIEMTANSKNFKFMIEGSLDASDLIDEIGPDETASQLRKLMNKLLPHVEAHMNDMLSDNDNDMINPSMGISLKLK